MRATRRGLMSRHRRRVALRRLPPNLVEQIDDGKRRVEKAYKPSGW